MIKNLIFVTLFHQIFCVSIQNSPVNESGSEINYSNLTKSMNYEVTTSTTETLLNDLEFKGILQAKQIPILPENPVNSAATTVSSYSPCFSKDDVTSCCSTIFTSKNCMKFRWIPDEFRFEFRIMMNGTQLLKRKFTGRNPEPVCMNVLGFSIFKICADFRNVHFRGRNMHLCLDTFIKYNKKRYLKRFRNQFECLLKISSDFFRFIFRQYDCMLMGEDGVKIISMCSGTQQQCSR